MPLIALRPRAADASDEPTMLSGCRHACHPRQHTPTLLIPGAFHREAVRDGPLSRENTFYSLTGPEKCLFYAVATLVTPGCLVSCSAFLQASQSKPLSLNNLMSPASDHILFCKGVNVPGAL